MTHGVVAEMFNFRLPHRDPPDRFLVATARVFELTLATADERLIGLGHCKILPNH